MKGIVLTPLRRICTPKGDVLHGMKAGDAGFAGFGEAYFSLVHPGAIKGWKRHRDMTLNLICVSGAVRVVVHDGSDSAHSMFDTVLSPDCAEQYQRLTIAPMMWVAFSGVAPAQDSMLLNLASHLHHPGEAENADLQTFAWP